MLLILFPLPGVIAKILLSLKNVIPVTDHFAHFKLAHIIMIIPEDEIPLPVHLTVYPVTIEAGSTWEIDFAIAVRNVLNCVTTEIPLLKCLRNCRVFRLLGRIED